MPTWPIKRGLILQVGETVVSGRACSLSRGADGSVVVGTSTGRIYSLNVVDLSLSLVCESVISSVTALAFGSRRYYVFGLKYTQFQR